MRIDPCATLNPVILFTVFASLCLLPASAEDPKAPAHRPQTHLVVPPEKEPIPAKPAQVIPQKPMTPTIQLPPKHVPASVAPLPKVPPPALRPKIAPQPRKMPVPAISRPVVPTQPKVTKVAPPAIRPARVPARPSVTAKRDAPTPPPIQQPENFRPPDHLLSDMERIRAQSEQGAAVEDAAMLGSVKGLFKQADRLHPRELESVGDAESIRDVLGMDGTEVDPRGMLREGDSALGQLESELGSTKRGPDEVSFMPDPTTGKSGLLNAGGDGLSGAPTGPLGPRDAMGGAASTKDDEPMEGFVNKEGEMVFGEDGSSSRTHRSGDLSTGTHTLVTETDNADGSTTQSLYQEEPNGSATFSFRTVDEDRNLLGEGSGSFPPGWRQDVDQQQGVDGDADPDGAWARWQAKISGQRPDLSLKNPDQTGPEEGGDTGPATGQINPGGSIVVNPDVAAEAGQAREVSAERAKHWQDQLKEKAGGIVNPEAMEEATEPE